MVILYGLTTWIYNPNNMKKCLASFFFLFFLQHAVAQDETVRQLKKEAEKKAKKEVDTVNLTWRKGGLYNLNLAQGSLSNWAAGGDDFSLTLTSYLNLYMFYKTDKRSWDNTLDFNFGYVNTTSLGSRKNDDRLDVLSKYGYAFSDKWNISGLANFRSQVADGFTYQDTVRTFSSAFLSPAYLLASVGTDYKPNKDLSIFISPLTSRWVFVKNEALSNRGLYGVDSGRHSNAEFGAFASVNYLKDITSYFQYKGRLDLFSNYKDNPQNVDLFMTNVFAVKLLKYLTASWNIDLIYDHDVKIFGEEGRSPALQVKSLIGAGLQIKF